MAENTPKIESLIPGLPDDIAMECLVRVPITSHPTLRLVSRGWTSAISHPSFFSLRRRLRFAERLLFLLHPPPHLPPSAQKDSSDSQDPPLYNLSLFNLSRREWRRFPIPIPTFAQCTVVPATGKLVVLGGWDPVTLEPISRVLVIDLAKGTWKEGSPMPEKRSFFACATVGDSTVYVAGGHDGRKNALNTAASYDVASDQWRILPSMSEERDECYGTSFGDSKFWVISGYGTETQGRFRPDCEVFDPESGCWTRIDEVWPYPSSAPKATAAAGGGRWVGVGDGELREFDWGEKRWKGLNSSRAPKRLGGSAVSMVDVGDEKIFVMSNGESCERACEEVGCGGDGALVLDRNDKECGPKWQHVHAPSKFLGFPFSASHLLI